MLTTSQICTTNFHILRVPNGRSQRHATIVQKLWSPHQPLPRHPGFTSLRFASIDTRSSAIAEVQSAFPSTAGQPQPGIADSKTWTDSDPSDHFINQGSPENLLNDGQPQVNEYIGFLKDMGLDYGWGTTAFVETLLEHIHVYAGTPWWMSIGLTVVAIRLFIFKFFINAQDASARIAAIKPLTADIDKRQQDATASRDDQEMRAIWLERRAIHRKFGIKTTRIVWPIFFQVPLGFGTFRLMRGMTTLPVPGFDLGGPLWLSDLTIPDPYYILPIATAATYYWTFRVSAKFLPFFLVESSRSLITIIFRNSAWRRNRWRKSKHEPNHAKSLSLRLTRHHRPFLSLVASRTSDSNLPQRHFWHQPKRAFQTGLVPKVLRYPAIGNDTNVCSNHNFESKVPGGK